MLKKYDDNDEYKGLEVKPQPTNYNFRKFH